jgi:hypothetical protein
MIVIYGWLKEKRPIKAVLNCYCYVCQRTEAWHVVRETEWVTFFGMRTIPFMSKDSLACGRCEDETPLDRAHSAGLLRGDETAKSIAFVEEFQLASKSEVQRNFLLSMRAGREPSTPAA